MAEVDPHNKAWREDDTAEASIEALKEASGSVAAAQAPDLGDDVDPFEMVLDGAEVLDEELVVRAVPRQEDEFVCPSCFLVLHERIRQPSGRCRDCD